MKKIFVVSCQALKDEPLYGDGIMTKMAKAAIVGGADWIRTSQLHNVKDMMKDLNVPIIGLIKKTYGKNPMHITPTVKELDDLIKTGVHIIAIDATLRKRPKESLEEMFKYFHKNKMEHQKLMADCSNELDVVNADRLGFDYISTTLRGYTEETKNLSNKFNDFEFIKKISLLTNKTIVAEGGITTPKEVKMAYQKGASIVVVGGAITRPRTIVKRFVDEIKGRK